MYRLYPLLLFIVSLISTAQEDFGVANISPALLENANAVIRFEETVIELDDFNAMTMRTREVITVFNRRGLNAISPIAYYDNSSSVRKIEARIYDKNGLEVKKYKKKDFVDLSASGTSLFTDNRKLVLEYTPTFYPFTFEFITEIKTSSTGFFPRWDPSPIYRVSTEYSKYLVLNPKQVPLTSRKYNLEEFQVSVSESPTKYSYEVKNLKAIDKEELSPHYTEFTPVVKIAPLKFQLEGKTAQVSSWKDFGIWQKQKLLDGRDYLPEQTKNEVTALVASLNNPKDKARAIYKFMQDKTRYISVQVGIGGWQPSTAAEVDKLGYGDCKGLTNYTKALLKSQGINSYYTIVDSGLYGRDLDEGFVALQGNHVILTVPFEDETVFLECTSQQIPFNYLGAHTDDRKVLMVTPEGGVLIKTHTYDVSENTKKLIATATLQESLKISGKLSIQSDGITYGGRYWLERETNDDVELAYKRAWGHLNDLSLSNIAFENNKEDVLFTESLVFTTDNYISKAGKRVLLNPNIFKRIVDIPSKEKKRTQPFVVRRGYIEEDQITLILPQNYLLESIFDPIVIKSKFGSYNASVQMIDTGTVKYSRQLIINSGRYLKEDFNAYVDFIKKVVKSDRSKIVMIQQ